MERRGKQKGHRPSEDAHYAVIVRIFDTQGALSICKDQVERLVKAFLKWKKVEVEEVIIHFATIDEISRLHSEHFDDPTPTDCISFPIDPPGEEKEGYRILGEIFVCPEVALSYAKKHAINPYREVSLYIIHGLLHLLGFDDQRETDEKIMRDEEKSAITYLQNNKVMLHA